MTEILAFEASAAYSDLPFAFYVCLFDRASEMKRIPLRSWEYLPYLAWVGDEELQRARWRTMLEA